MDTLGKMPDASVRCRGEGSEAGAEAAAGAGTGAGGLQWSAFSVCCRTSSSSLSYFCKTQGSNKL